MSQIWNSEFACCTNACTIVHVHAEKLNEMSVTHCNTHTGSSCCFRKGLGLLCLMFMIYIYYTVYITNVTSMAQSKNVNCKKADLRKSHKKINKVMIIRQFAGYVEHRGNQ